MSLDDLVHNFLDDPQIPPGPKDGIRALWESHLARGRDLQQRGLLREAIDEYSKEHDRPINSQIDADIVQTSYWFVGRAYRALGELDKAIVALQKSRELVRRHGVGTSPHQDLAEIFISQGRFEEAIEVCQESLEKAPAWPLKQLLARAIDLKEQTPKQKGDTDQP